MQLLSQTHLCHLLPVGFGVEWSLGQQDWMLLRSNTELVVEGVMPNLQGRDVVNGGRNLIHLLKYN